MENYENLLEAGAYNSIGEAIYALVQDCIKSAGTSFLATVTNVTNNKVSIKRTIKKEGVNDVVINNCLVGFPTTQDFFMQYKINVGDIGVALIMDCDISSYKKTGAEGNILTERNKDLNDSIFLPLSLFKELKNEDVELLISSRDGNCKMEFKENNILLKANLLTLQSQNTTLKTMLAELSDILAGAKIMQSESGVQPFDSGTISKFNSWKSDLSNLFKD